MFATAQAALGGRCTREQTRRAPGSTMTGPPDLRTSHGVSPRSRLELAVVHSTLERCPNVSSSSRSRTLLRRRCRDGRRRRQGEDQNKEQERLAACGVVMNEVLNVPDNVPQEILDNAECVIVIPSMTKVALGLGGSYGRGAMVCRSGKAYNGSWGAPAMYAIESGSFGLQLGAESTDVVLMIMNPRGVDALLNSKVTLGGEASAAAGPKGRTIKPRRTPPCAPKSSATHARVGSSPASRSGHVAPAGRRRDGTGVRSQDHCAPDRHRDRGCAGLWPGPRGRAAEARALQPVGQDRWPLMTVARPTGVCTSEQTSLAAGRRMSEASITLAGSAHQISASDRTLRPVPWAERSAGGARGG